MIDEHIDESTAIRKGRAEVPVEPTFWPVRVAGKQRFCVFRRDLGERGRSATAADHQSASSQT